MHTLHVRSVPEDLYSQLKSLAQSEQRSLSAQVISMLERSLKLEQQRQEQIDLLHDIRRRRFVPPAGTPDSVGMIRADRSR